MHKNIGRGRHACVDACECRPWPPSPIIAAPRTVGTSPCPPPLKLADASAPSIFTSAHCAHVMPPVWWARFMHASVGATVPPLGSSSLLLFRRSPALNMAGAAAGSVLTSSSAPARSPSTPASDSVPRRAAGDGDRVGTKCPNSMDGQTPRRRVERKKKRNGFSPPSQKDEPASVASSAAIRTLPL